MDDKQQLTYGEDLVGKKFNPSGDDKVDFLKSVYGQIIDTLNDFRSANAENADIARHCSIAITEAQGAQMWAVKAVTRGK